MLKGDVEAYLSVVYRWPMAQAGVGDESLEYQIVSSLRYHDYGVS